MGVCTGHAGWIRSMGRPWLDRGRYRSRPDCGSVFSAYVLRADSWISILFTLLSLSQLWQNVRCEFSGRICESACLNALMGPDDCEIRLCVVCVYQSVVWVSNCEVDMLMVLHFGQ
ncbi:hypothetical protein K470DRAFT_255592 [Piedraia hortae CBS 480.64]|uniref:Uncharacterized protein n=1 Tax=Piedraia hortae CBS 480.64 TaxID=1314780 RepID=A0A6A7C6Q3_9PEZI|nr:hypothetical protein K470DRAFT_255592 [Piedraia hortae CBS 480.64]